MGRKRGKRKVGLRHDVGPKDAKKIGPETNTQAQKHIHIHATAAYPICTFGALFFLTFCLPRGFKQGWVLVSLPVGRTVGDRLGAICQVAVR